MQQERSALVPIVAFLLLLAMVIALWGVLALLCGIFPVIFRWPLALLTSGILLGGFVWYAVASWTGRGRLAGMRRFGPPVTLFLLGWLLCWCSVLAASLAHHGSTEFP